LQIAISKPRHGPSRSQRVGYRDSDRQAAIGKILDDLLGQDRLAAGQMIQAGDVQE
jgi:hypothetical protein